MSFCQARVMKNGRVTNEEEEDVKDKCKIHKGDTSVVLEISAALDMRELLLGGFRCIVTDHLKPCSV